MIGAFVRDLRFGTRSVLKQRGFAAAVVITLALGIGANAAIFSLVRAVLLRPLVNRGEERIVYIRQSAPGLHAANTTFSVPEIEDFKAGAKMISAFADFSTIDFTLIGFGEPRVVKAGVVNGTFFEVMGLRPVLGRLLTPADDGPNAAGAVVLTHRFWTSALKSDPAVIGKAIRLGPRNATVVGVLEPSVPYPADTEIMANLVTSPHHLSATMATSRTHRMTELFGRLAAGASVEAARAELTGIHASVMRQHPEAYPAQANVQLSVRPLRDQISAPARTILLVLLAATATIFLIACSNVASLMLARSVRRENELAVRVALGASHRALRRMLLAEGLVLCGAGALLGVGLANPFVQVLSRYVARFSVRALEVRVDGSVLAVGAALAISAAVVLAFVPRLPSAHSPNGLGLASGNLWITPSTNRRLRLFATLQIAFSFMLLAGAATLLAALVALQTMSTGYDMRQVLAIDVPTPSIGIRDVQETELYHEMARRIGQRPGSRAEQLRAVARRRQARSRLSLHDRGLRAARY
jgi:putative ABC transport system permease protein